MSLYQRYFIETLQGQNRTQALDTGWSLYADAYLGRPVEALCGSIFERVSHLFGKNFIQSLLSDYIQSQPPQHPIMVELTRGFVTWLEQKGWAQSNSECLELLSLSIIRWDVLIGADPELPVNLQGKKSEEMDRLALQKNHALVASSIPIYDLWMAGDPDFQGAGERFIAQEKQALLLYKSSPIALECVSIPQDLLPFVTSLSQGNLLGDALENFLDQHPDATVQLPEFLQYLLQSSAFTDN